MAFPYFALMSFMELQHPSLTILFLTFFFLFFVVRILKIISVLLAKNPKAKLPPGPRKLPLIGNMHQLISSLPHRTLRDLAMKHGPLMHLQLGEVPAIIISSPEIAKEVLKDHSIIFAQRPQLLASKLWSYNSPGLAFSPYGNYWKQLRKASAMELLSPSRVQSFRSIREEEVSALFDTIASNQGKSPINLSEKIFSMTYGITYRAAFGKKCKHQDEFTRIMKEAIKLSSGFCLADMYPSIELLKVISGVRLKLEKLHRTSDLILETIVNEHNEKLNRTSEFGSQPDEEDLLDVLLKLQRSCDNEIPLTNDDIKVVILDILGTGSETSSTTIEWAMSEMVKNPRLMKQVQAEVRQVFRNGKVDEAGIDELKFLRSVVKETLRLHPPAPLLVPRECDEDCVISGYDILAKTRVIVNAWAIGRDPKYWKEAENFDPERFLDSSIDFRGTNFQYIPFGAGRRICPGISFALPNIELPLAKLLYHFDWKLPNGRKFEDLDMAEGLGITVRRKNGLLLIPIPYQPLTSE